MATSFQDILDRLNYLNYDNWAELNKIKAIAKELIKRSFPTDYSSTVHAIEEITFKTKPGQGFPIEAWEAGLGTFIGIIEAKKETFDLKGKSSANFNHGSTNYELYSEIEKLKQDKIDLQKRIQDQTSDFVKVKAKTRKYDSSFWTIIIGVPSLLFIVGYYLGNNRFDAEKLSMRDSIINLNVEKLSMKDSVTNLDSEKNADEKNILSLQFSMTADSIRNTILQKKKDSIITILHKKDDSTQNLNSYKKKKSIYDKKPVLHRKAVYRPDF